MLPLLLVAPAFAADLPQAAPRSALDIPALLSRYPHDPQRIAKAKAVLAAPVPAGGDERDLARIHYERAKAAQQFGAVAVQLAELRLALKLSSGRLPELEYRLLDELAWTSIQGGNFADAVEALEGRRRLRPRSAIVQASIAQLRIVAGDVAGGEAQLKLAEGLRSTSPHNYALWHHTETAMFEQTRAYLFIARGKLREAESAFRTALNSINEDLKINPSRIERRIDTPPQDALESWRGALESYLAYNLIAQGRIAEADAYIWQRLQRELGLFGPGSTGAAQALNMLTLSLYEQGRYFEAERSARASLDIFDRSGAIPSAGSVLRARAQLGQIHLAQERWSEAAENFSAVLAAAATPSARRLVAAPYGVALTKLGKGEEAIELLRQRIDVMQANVGAADYSVGEARGILGMALSAAGRRDEAHAEFRQAVEILVSARGAADRGELTAPRVKTLSLILEAYIEFLGSMRGSDADAESFRLADALRGRSVQQAINASAARGAARDEALAVLIRKEQDLRNELAALHGFLNNMAAGPREQQLPKVMADMRARIVQIAAERARLVQEIERRFPGYANLVTPRPASVDAARRVLRQGEVILSVLVGSQATHVWAVPKSGPVRYHAAPIGRGDVERVVATLRRALDPGDVPLARLPEFDLETAHRLYADLVRPVEASLQGASTVFVVANGALSQLPFSVLPTEAGKRPYRDTPWLARKVAVAQLPSVNSLITLRSAPPGSHERVAFAGFGDPAFGNASPEPRASRLRNLTLGRITQEALQAGKPVAWIPYSQLAPLPDTREEIMALAETLNADLKRDVFLGRQATKSRVKSVDLSNRRVVAFATHGLLPGDFPGLDQPALALAPAEGIDPDREPLAALLTLEDILGLKLDADWVVLSACNTAAGDGAAADAVSGLGRGFFYAGSRALLATHWPVESRSARMLVSSLFARYAQDATLSRAEALRRSMLELIEHPEDYSHPLFWAPYALIGDAAR